MSPLALSLHFLQAQPDDRLVALAREGHEPAFEALVRRYRKELLSYCRRLQPRSGSAEDALQQTLLQAWRALKSGADVRDVRAWLYRIAHNVTLNNLRVTVAVPEEAPETASGHEIDQLVEHRLRARAALAGVAALPTLQRQVFVSTTLDGASHEEVASALGLSSGAVRGLIYRARATLRAAAAALTPSPALHWAVRRAEMRTGGSSMVEAVAGGGGAGVAGLVMKGGAVLTLAGAVTGGGVILSDAHQHRHAPARLVRSSDPRRDEAGSTARGSGLASLTLAGAARVARAAAINAGDNQHAHSAQPGPGHFRGREDSSPRGDQGGSSRGSESEGGSRTGSDGGLTSGSSGGSSGGSLSGSDGASGSGTTTASSSGGTSNSSSGSSDGGSTSSSSSGSDAGTTGVSSTIGGLLTTTDGGLVGSSPDGGSSSGSDGSGSGETTTSAPH